MTALDESNPTGAGSMNPPPTPSELVSALGTSVAWRLILCLRIQALVLPSPFQGEPLSLYRSLSLLTTALEGSDEYWNNADPSSRTDWERFLGIERLIAMHAAGILAAVEYLRRLPGWRGDDPMSISARENHGYVAMALFPQGEEFDSATRLARKIDFNPASFALDLFESIRTSGSPCANEALTILSLWTRWEFERFEIEKATAPLSTSIVAPAEREPKRL